MPTYARPWIWRTPIESWNFGPATTSIATRGAHDGGERQAGPEDHADVEQALERVGEARAVVARRPREHRERRDDEQARDLREHDEDPKAAPNSPVSCCVETSDMRTIVR